MPTSRTTLGTPIRVPVDTNAPRPLPADEPLATSPPSLQWRSPQLPSSPWERSTPKPLPASEPTSLAPDRASSSPTFAVGSPRSKPYPPTVNDHLGLASHSIYVRSSIHCATDPPHSGLGIVTQRWTRRIVQSGTADCQPRGAPIPVEATSNVPSVPGSIPISTGGIGHAARSPTSRTATRTRITATRNPRYSTGTTRPRYDRLRRLPSSSPSPVVGIVAAPSPSSLPITNRYTRELEGEAMNTFHSSACFTGYSGSASFFGVSSTEMARMHLASQVSQKLLEQETTFTGPAPLPVEPPTGWKSIEIELRGHLQECDALLKRNAVFQRS